MDSLPYIVSFLPALPPGSGSTLNLITNLRARPQGWVGNGLRSARRRNGTSSPCGLRRRASLPPPPPPPHICPLRKFCFTKTPGLVENLQVLCEPEAQRRGSFQCHPFLRDSGQVSTLLGSLGCQSDGGAGCCEGPSSSKFE